MVPLPPARRGPSPRGPSRRPFVPVRLVAALPAAALLALALVPLAGCGGCAAAPPPEKLVHLGDLVGGSGPGPPRQGGVPRGRDGAAPPRQGGEAPSDSAAPPALPPGEATPELPYEVSADFSAGKVGRLRLEAQGTARLATLSWRLPQDHGFNRYRALSFPVAGDGRPHVYEVDLGREAHWHGRIEGLRLAVDGGRLRLASLTAEASDDPYRSTSLGGETIPALAGGGRVVLPLPADLPAGTVFEARAGLLPEYDRPGVTAAFRAYLVEGKELGRAAERLRPWLAEIVKGGDAGGPAWRLVRRELPGGGGRGGRRLVLVAGAERDGEELPEGAVVWGDPLLIRPGRPEGRNLVVILVDTLRADVLGSYGDRGGLTPRLDAFARQGVRFAGMLAPSSWTLPSVCSLLTGLQPQTHGAGQRFGDLDPSSPRQNDFAPTGLPGGARTLAGVLRRQGFYTLGIYQNFYILPGFGVQQGFDEYTSVEDRAEVLVDRALARLRQTAGDRRIFLYLHLFDMHSPYDPPEPECTQVARRLAPSYHGRLGCTGDRNPERTTIPPPADRPWFQALYRAELAYTDRQVGRFLDGLRELRLEDRTVVALVSDHGEEFWDRLGQEGELGYETNSDHGHTLYQELVHVPALLRIPGRRPAVVRDAVQMVDLFPTLLRAAGVEPPPSQGSDLTPLLDGRPVTARPTLIADVVLHGRPRWSVRRGSWKLVVGRDPALPVELYHLERDPGERTNLAAAQPRLVAALRTWGERELAARQQARALYLPGGAAVGVTYLEWRYITKLRALGYLK
jgi:arylsulfatase A-like enzyme